MKMKIIILLLLIVPVLASGCASVSGQPREQMTALPGQYAGFDLKMGWEVKKADELVLVEGVVKNTRYAFMEDLEIWITPQDMNGKSLARSVSFFVPGTLRLDDYAAFSIRLPSTTAPIANLLFMYRYTGEDGGEDGGGMFWMNSFVAKFPD